MSLMKRNSVNANVAGEPDFKIQRRYLTHDAEAFDTRVEWHHCAGDVIGFYPQDGEETERVLDFIEMCKTRFNEKKDNALSITSKAAAWRYIAQQQALKLGATDSGFGSVNIKYGKYGAFVPSFGKPDNVYFFQTQDEKNTLRTWI